MFRKPTVFILGAGANFEFGLPGTAIRTDVVRTRYRAPDAIADLICLTFGAVYTWKFGTMRLS